LTEFFTVQHQLSGILYRLTLLDSTQIQAKGMPFRQTYRPSNWYAQLRPFNVYQCLWTSEVILTYWSYVS